MKKVSKSVRKNTKNLAKEEDLEKKLWQLDYHDLCEIHVRLLRKNHEKEHLIKDLLRQVNHEELAFQTSWFILKNRY